MADDAVTPSNYQGSPSPDRQHYGSDEAYQSALKERAAGMVQVPKRNDWMYRDGCGAPCCWRGLALFEKAEMPPRAKAASGAEPIGVIYVERYWGTCPACNGNWKSPSWKRQPGQPGERHG